MDPASAARVGDCFRFVIQRFHIRRGLVEVDVITRKGPVFFIRDDALAEVVAIAWIVRVEVSRDGEYLASLLTGIAIRLLILPFRTGNVDIMGGG